MTTIDITRLNEDPHESVNGIRADTTTRGVDLEGATITATFADGTVETLTWHALDPYTNGGATGTDIEMSYGYTWHELTTTKLLTSLEFDLQPASSVFDTTTDPDYPPGLSTPGSKVGFPFQLAPEHAGMGGSIDVTYTGIVNLAGSPAVGDLYTTMIVDFTGLPGGGLLGDLKWNSDIDTMRDAGDLVPTGVACFTRGTAIATDRGEVPVEALRPGDRVLTQDNGYQELQLVVRHAIGSKALYRDAKLLPIRIMAGALGAGLPVRDLVVSRQHRMVANSSIVKRMFGAATVLVAAIRLTELPGVHVEADAARVEYYHLVFDRHEVIFAHGAPTESFLMTPDARRTLGPANCAAIEAMLARRDAPDAGADPARTIPTHGLQRKLVYRHLKNAKALLNAPRDHRL